MPKVEPWGALGAPHGRIGELWVSGVRLHRGLWCRFDFDTDYSRPALGDDCLGGIDLVNRREVSPFRAGQLRQHFLPGWCRLPTSLRT